MAGRAQRLTHPRGCNDDQGTKRLMETAAKTIDKDGKEKAGTTF